MRAIWLATGAALALGAGLADAAAAKGRYAVRAAPPGAPYGHVLDVKLDRFTLPGTFDREVCQYFEIPARAVPAYCVPGDEPGAPDVCGAMIVGYRFRMRGRGVHHMVLYTFEGPASIADELPAGVRDSWGCLDGFGPPEHVFHSNRLLGTAVRSWRKMLRPGTGELVQPVRRASGQARGFGLIVNLHAVTSRGGRSRGGGSLRLYLARPGTVRARLRRWMDVFPAGLMVVPPGSRQHVGGDWWIGGPRLPYVGGPPAHDVCIVSAGGHHHRRTVVETIDLFRAEGAEGPERVWENSDWLHPRPDHEFDPPLHFRRGMRFRYDCLIDNGVANPPRMGCELEAGVPPGRSLADVFLTEGRFDGTARRCASDADCDGVGTGRCVPANLVWGYSSDDEMCAFAGPYYDAIPGAPPGRECDVSLAPALDRRRPASR